MHVPCFEILPKKYIIIYFSTNKFRTVMNIPSYYVRTNKCLLDFNHRAHLSIKISPKYINVITYHVGNNM